MAEEIDLGGTIYISSKRAAEITGYTQDYIGQLSRGGSIAAQRVSGLWYVIEASLNEYKLRADEYKPEPPKGPHHAIEMEAVVSFDGKNYISAQRAAKVTGYHHDYVGQLARSGKLLSRQIGNRWYVDREGIVEHKKYNDSLLAAVQAESVGLSKDLNEISAPHADDDLHFKYSDEPIELIPAKTEETFQEEDEAVVTDDIETEIPIRVIRKESQQGFRLHARVKKSIFSHQRLPKVTLAVLVLFIAGLGGGYMYFPVILRGNSEINENLAAAPESITRRQQLDIPAYRESYLPDSILDIISTSVKYNRDSF